MSSLENLADTLPQFLMIGAAGTLYTSWCFFLNDIAEGIKTYAIARHTLHKIARGAEIASKDHWTIADAKIEPYASMLMGISGGRKLIYKAYRQRKSLQ